MDARKRSWSASVISKVVFGASSHLVAARRRRSSSLVCTYSSVKSAPAAPRSRGWRTARQRTSSRSRGRHWICWQALLGPLKSSGPRGCRGDHQRRSDRRAVPSTRPVSGAGPGGPRPAPSREWSSHSRQPDGEEQVRAWVHISNHAESRRSSASELHGAFVRASCERSLSVRRQKRKSRSGAPTGCPDADLGHCGSRSRYFLRAGIAWMTISSPFSRARVPPPPAGGLRCRSPGATLGGEGHPCRGARSTATTLLPGSHPPTRCCA
jgi:hypothetical protein